MKSTVRVGHVLLQAIVLLVNSHALAATCAEGAGQIMTGNFGKAMEIWERDALDDSPKEKLRADMGCLKLEGIANRDPEVALWFLERADEGLPSAQMYVGMLFAAGVGLPKDISVSRQWLERARDNNAVGAEFLLRVVEDMIASNSERGSGEIK